MTKNTASGLFLGMQNHKFDQQIVFWYKLTPCLKKICNSKAERTSLIHQIINFMSDYFNSPDSIIVDGSH
jgi:hypothetical protein